jgi:CRP/FNR family transcriptional regulator
MERIGFGQTAGCFSYNPLRIRFCAVTVRASVGNGGVVFYHSFHWVRDKMMHQVANTASAFDFQPAATGVASRNLEDLFNKQPVERFDPGETVFFEGDPARHVFQVNDGVVRLCKILVDGRRIVTGFLFAGDVVGISQHRKFLYSAEAVTPVKVRRIARRALDEAIEFSPLLRPQVFTRLCAEMAAAQEQMILLSCKSAEERLCSFLAFLMKRSRTSAQNGVVIDLPMTRLDIADYLGLTIETVSRNLTKLAKRGIIAEVERFSLRVLKPQALEEIGGMWDDDCGMQSPRPASVSSYRH